MNTVLKSQGGEYTEREADYKIRGQKQIFLQCYVSNYLFIYVFSITEYILCVKKLLRVKKKQIIKQEHLSGNLF